MKFEAINISKSYSGNKILQDVNIHLNDGEIISIIGPSGIGKSTLFNILSGIESPDNGKILLSEKDITSKVGKVAYMPQRDLLLPYKNIIDNVSLPLLFNNKSKKEARKEALPLFKTFDLENSEYKYPHELSGGMKQRAALLRTYLCFKEVALLDEPFSALDAITKSKMHKWYLELMKQIMISTIFITHDIDEAIYLSDRIYILNGKPAKVTNEIIIERDSSSKKDFLLNDKFLKYKKMIIDILSP